MYAFAERAVANVSPSTGPSEGGAETDVEATAEQVIGHRVGVRIGEALDIGRLAVEEIVDAELEARLVVDLIGELEIVVKDVRRAVADLAGRRIEVGRSEEHTSELQSLMRISYAVFCLKKKNI